MDGCEDVIDGWMVDDQYKPKSSLSTSTLYEIFQKHYKDQAPHSDGVSDVA